MSSAAASVISPSFQRVYELADIRRAASLTDVRVEVSVAHTRSRLRARFCVNMNHINTNTKWAFGVDLKEVRHFESNLVYLVRSHKKSKCSCRARHEPTLSSCPMCVQLRQELKQWPRFPPFSSLGKRHLDVKCEMLTQFFYRLFRVLSLHAQWLQSCDLLIEVLRATEAMCRVQYNDDKHALGIIASLKRVTPLLRAPLRTSSYVPDECSICLVSIYEPAEAPAHASDPAMEISVNQPTQGVELPCGHRFHDSCICMWFHTRLTCPVCRQETTCSNNAEH